MGKTRRGIATHAPRARTGAPQLFERFSRRDHSHAQLHMEVAEWKLLDLTRADLERYAREAALEEYGEIAKEKLTLSDFVAAAAAEPEYDYGGVGGPVEEEPPAEDEVGGGEHLALAEEVVPENYNVVGAEDEQGPDHGVGFGGGEEDPAQEEIPESDNGGGGEEDSENNYVVGADDEEGPGHGVGFGGGEEDPAQEEIDTDIKEDAGDAGSGGRVAAEEEDVGLRG